MTRNPERGASEMQSLLVLGVVIIPLVLALIVFTRKPELLDKGVAIAFVGGGLAALGWSGKQAIASLERRAELLILEDLSQGHRRSRRELQRRLASEYFVFRCLRTIHADVLAVLVRENRVVVADGLYAISASNTKREHAVKESDANSTSGAATA